MAQGLTHSPSAALILQPSINEILAPPFSTIIREIGIEMTAHHQPRDQEAALVATGHMNTQEQKSPGKRRMALVDIGPQPRTQGKPCLL